MPANVDISHLQYNDKRISCRYAAHFSSSSSDDNSLLFGVAHKAVGRYSQHADEDALS